jgi:hypothetical protein
MIHDECNFGTCLKCCELLDVDICDHAHFGSQLQVKLSGECHRAHVTWHVWHVFHQVLFTCQDWDTCHCHNNTFYISQFFSSHQLLPSQGLQRHDSSRSAWHVSPIHFCTTLSNTEWTSSPCWNRISTCWVRGLPGWLKLGGRAAQQFARMHN